MAAKLDDLDTAEAEYEVRRKNHALPKYEYGKGVTRQVGWAHMSAVCTSWMEWT